MAICKFCEGEMKAVDGCTVTEFDDMGPQPFKRVRYGEEEDDWGALSGRRCHDCYVKPGQFHHPGCDVERCPKCSGQAIGCDCVEESKE